MLEELRVRHKNDDKLVLDSMNLSRTREKTMIVGPDDSGSRLYSGRSWVWPPSRAAP